MNTNKIKTYAPQARRDFINAVTRRAARFGIEEDNIQPMQETGDLVFIGGEAFPKSIALQRRKLEKRIQNQGYQQTIEATAYTWFNRFAAIRYMELHEYLDHTYRVLSHPAGNPLPEILKHAEHVDLPGLDKNKIIELKLDGTQDEALYRELLLGQCRALHQAMPFLFEAIDDETELLLPDNLTQTNSLIRQLVDEIPEEDWQEVEIIGWLYQFYISEKKDQVIGKVVKSEDIPAATQLFTPNWIVKYMVQNSLGAQWLATYPQSPLKGQMDYYIEPAEQTDEVKAQLAAITPNSLNPEDLTLIDPACGSGHILVEAYELFKAIYLERGYRQRDVPQLVLEKNLFGLDIDERAAQLTGFALMMKGRADDRRLFEREVKLNVMALAGSARFDAEVLVNGVELSDYGLKPGDLTELKRLFEHATTFGSLIQVPEELAKKLPALKQLSEATSQDLFVAEALKRLGPLVQQAELLAAQYDAVVANPPYIGSKYHIPTLKKFLKDNYKGYEKDVFSAFINRDLAFSKPHGRLGFMSPFVWMFLSSHEHLRIRLIDRETITSLIQLEYSGFEGATVPICTYTLQKGHVSGQQSCYIRLSNFRGTNNQAPKTIEAIRNRNCGWFFEASQDEFGKIPGSPIAYWVTERFRNLFDQSRSLREYAIAKQGMATGDNDRFLRRWHETGFGTVGFGYIDKREAQGGDSRWFPFNKGGEFRRWFGNHEYVIRFDIGSYHQLKQSGNHCPSEKYYFQPSVSWSDVTSSDSSFRRYPAGFIHGNVGHSAFGGDEKWRAALLAYCNSKFVCEVIKLLCPTMHFDVGYFNQIPYLTEAWASDFTRISDTCVSISTLDWNAYERSWDFQSLPLLTASSEPTPTLESSYTAWITQNRDTIAEMKHLEEENNRLFIDAYGLADELTPDVPLSQITLTVNPAYRYGGKLNEEEQWTRFRQDSMQELISYAIGCMMGRYSLDAPGLIYAHSGNEGFSPNKYTTFPADDDGIIPLTDTDWFTDDAANRLVDFISVAWDAAHLEENLSFLAENLSPKKNEASRETIRRYLSAKFFKDHLKTYKKRPIYWLFSSGKQKAFECLVYLHRYNEGTLARMRMEYVVPLQSRLTGRIDQLDGDITAASTTANRNKLQKQKDKLVKQREELARFDEKLRHYADQRIPLDLDDGVKVNYGKFGDLLAEVKSITGKKPNDS
ncbi:BREX-1 system adenine-specific DNA-methyltransferase PglX [endosymbiont of Lamellibrachia barhami]|uniref:BREX-1 system adenine-specific DNA-methyltransferase PglX n=1 Tax=endosymbiont of Lamellibrachia barhami TaxID=205975 RepID=UPI0015ACD384|nr:BREX-1 system adenine-specific DNA-methyltransferase PglX [endosymbiont of Lamellibrachia barhami]